MRLASEAYQDDLCGRGVGGGDEGTRTPDPCDANAVLFQLSYIPAGLRRVAAFGIGSIPPALKARPERQGPGLAHPG